MTDQTHRNNFLKISALLGVFGTIAYIVVFSKFSFLILFLYLGIYFFSVFLIWKMWYYIMDSFNELTNKVTWPSWIELQSSTIVVAIATVIIALIIYIMDKSFDNILKIYYNII
jgi:preprotein translocase subunit SecE